MKLSEDEINLIQKHKSKFASFKYLGDDGFLKQLDIHISAIKNHSFFTENTLSLRPIKSKSFIDPFRSILTTSFYCENHSNTVNPRIIAEKLHNSFSYPLFNEYFAQISFWVVDEQTGYNDLSYMADPIDPYANLRADIISTLEEIGIETTYHHHGKTNNESVIGIKGKALIDLADNFIIAKFVIANIATSYNMSISFTYNNSINLKLFLKTEESEVIEVFSSLTDRSKQVSTFSTQTNEYFFELKEIHKYEVDNKTVLNIELMISEQFIPYLCLVDLLSYKIKPKLVEKELSLFFKK